MQSEATTADLYIEALSEERKLPMQQLRQTILDNLPEGFVEIMSNGMISYVVPQTLYPKGYHVNSNLPLPFLSIASQKNFIALYHMGIYASKELYNWFVEEYPKHNKTKLDMGKSCVRFKKPEQLPYGLIAELVSKMDAQEWIRIYEENYAGR